MRCAITQDIPPGIDLAKELRAADIAPVGLGIGGARGGQATGRALDRPPRLSGPDGLALRNGDGLLVGRFP